MFVILFSNLFSIVIHFQFLMLYFSYLLNTDLSYATYMIQNNTVNKAIINYMKWTNRCFIKCNVRGFNMKSIKIHTPCNDKIISVHSDTMLYLVIKYDMADMLYVIPITINKRKYILKLKKHEKKNNIYKYNSIFRLLVLDSYYKHPLTFLQLY